MRSFQRLARGQVAVIMTLVIAVMLGAMTLGVDCSLLYFNWMQLQKAADSAALAGAEYYGPQGSTLNPGCSSYGSIAQNEACDYALKNGVTSGEIKSITTDSTAATVHVALYRDTIPVLFGRFLGIDKWAVSAAATAQGALPAITITNGLFPIGLQLPTSPLNYGAVVSLYQGQSPGNWGFLDLQTDCNPPGSLADNGKVPGNDLATVITSGSTCGFEVNTTVVFPEPGNKANGEPVRTAIQGRVGPGGPAPADTSQISADNPQLVTLPIVDWTGTHGKSTGMIIQGFAEFWLTGFSGRGNSIQLTGEFIKYVNANALGSTSATDWGVNSRIALVN
ncbi:MAG: pilus assembly protein TadG-related protein [Candidatus Binataceae bacterium]